MSLYINTARAFLKHPAYILHLILLKLRMRRRYRWAALRPDQDHAVPPPLICKALLTYRCNSRCTMCMQWGNTGWCTENTSSEVSEELDWEILRRAMEQVGKHKPDFVFSGGEPLLYSHLTDLAGLLKELRCYATFCTNGLLLDQFYDVFAGNRYLVPLVSLDGLKEENDRIRGKGNYDKVVSNIQLLKSARHAPYVGIQFTVQPENTGKIYEFCKRMVSLNVDWILLNPRWFISEEQARKYEDEVRQSYGFVPVTHRGYLSPYLLDRPEFIRQFRQIRTAKWPVQISSYLKTPEDINAYIDYPDKPVGNDFCYKQWIRIDISPSGSVSPCIQFPDISFENLQDTDILKIWNSESYVRFRRAIRGKLLPICPKCNSLYLYDASRQISLSEKR